MDLWDIGDFFSFGQASRQRKRVLNQVNSSGTPEEQIVAGTILKSEGTVQSGAEGLGLIQKLEAPKNDYDLTDAMVQAARRVSAARATGGFGLAQTFRTRSLDATPPEQRDAALFGQHNPGATPYSAEDDSPSGLAGYTAPRPAPVAYSAEDDSPSGLVGYTAPSQVPVAYSPEDDSPSGLAGYTAPVPLSPEEIAARKMRR